jgi:hypothetical protein
MFKLRLLPTLQEYFEETLGIGRYWPSDRILEIREGANPYGRFLADTSSGKMWGRLILRSADAPGGLESATAKSAALDEAGQDNFTVTAWRAIRRRLALAQGRILITTTLYNLGWLVSQVVSQIEKGGTVAVTRLGDYEVTVTDNGPADMCLVQYDSTLNPLFPKTEFEQARALMEDAEFQMFYRGRVATPATLVYGSFNSKKCTIPRFAIPPKWNVLCGLDFGDVNTAAVAYAIEPGTGRLFAFAEYHKGGLTSAQHAKEILAMCGRVPDCFGGAASEGQWRREFLAGGLPVRKPAVADVALGIRTVYAEHAQDHIYYFDDLAGILDEKGRYRRKRGKDGSITDEIEDKSSFHLLDAERYAVASHCSSGGVWTLPMGPKTRGAGQ